VVELVNAPPELDKVRRTYFAPKVGPWFSPAVSGSHSSMLSTSPVRGSPNR
jgi:hypothetical protein